MKKIIGFIPHVIAVFAAAVFLDSLRYKFTDAPETQEIFGRLDGWAGTLGLGGLFSETGLFSQYTIGTAELFASALLLIGIIPALRRLQALGALIALAVMSGAVSFHLFTPLGIDPNNDGGGLFMSAVIIWVTSLVMLVIRRKELTGLVGDIGAALVRKD
ncbi:hypothetical protein [Ponticaulis sp.]|uniref:hypothetical protein n=1 Tax=Ponticaulis sp. TaxID=2020902 RepID=UPI000C4E6681|nr:hypothetical protein [Ponticaulis sp.]MAJ08573.1 hypothetical protein [Ponticaulis sp.]HBH90369.1 hypothetical protein [Hyphomonadaceae bacterium]|tara:strand:+ start:17554 stop:18033 length:480 start_codon:yes stop_codon:yes gene_type:complete